MAGRRALLRFLFCFALVCFAITSTAAFSQSGGELRFWLRREPETFDPLLVDDDSSLSIRYLPGRLRVRGNRKRQHLPPEPPAACQASNDGHPLTYMLHPRPPP